MSKQPSIAMPTMGLGTMTRYIWYIICHHTGGFSAIISYKNLTYFDLCRFMQPEGAGSSSVSDELLSVASQLMNHIYTTHHSTGVTVPETDPDHARHVAAAALAAAEANGAIPPLSAAQRHSFQAALEEVARHTPKTPEIDSISEPDDPAHWFEMSEEGADEIIIKPEFRSLFEQLATLNFSKGWGDGDRKYNSKQEGGEVGNISTGQGQNISSSAAGKNPGAFAEGGTERAERAAEAEYMNLEVNAFEPHAKNVGSRSDHGVVNGDAPSAGGGMQTAGDDEREEKARAADF